MKLATEKQTSSNQQSMQEKTPAKLVRAIILLTAIISLLSSCTTLNSENPCTLRAEQVPEVRGLHLGMKLQDLEKKFSTMCRPTGEDFNDEDFELWATVRPSVESQGRKDCGPSFSQTASTYFSIDPNQNPEFVGVRDVELAFNKNYLATIELTYEHTRDEQFKTAFHTKTKSALGLDRWTNWELSVFERPRVLDGKTIIITQLTDTLECDKASVVTEIEEWATPIGNTYFPKMVLKADVKAVEIEKRRGEFDKEKEKHKANSNFFKP